MRIAYVNPPHADWSIANCTAYLMFQSHYNRFGKYASSVEWIPSPFKYNKYTTVEEIFEEIETADVILFSSYVWNYDIIDELSSYAKKINPHVICVLGGPHIGENDKAFLQSRPQYDFILKATKPGEIFVQELIDTMFEKDHVSYNDLSWEIRSDKTCSQFMPEYSVYAEHIPHLTILREYAKESCIEPFITLETTRGCPYKCSYCEWGGGIGTKIYKKPIEVVKEDILALKQAGYRDVSMTDANFGAFFERDVSIFKFAWDNGVNLTDISTMKSKDLARRINLVDAWFDIVGSGPETHSEVTNPREVGQILMPGTEVVVEKNNKGFVSIVPTASIQSVSEEAMKVANRVDLSFKDKIALSEHVYKRCNDEGFPVPAIELILGMPGSTLDDFYEEMSLIRNFQAWENFRHDYMFLPDSGLTEPNYKEKLKIKTVTVYSDLVDEHGADNQNSLYKNKRMTFDTISECYSYTLEELCEMWFMNIAGNFVLRYIYPQFEDTLTPSEFGRHCFDICKQLNGFDEIFNQIRNLLDPNTPPQNIKRINGIMRTKSIGDFIMDNKELIYSEMFVRTL